MDIRKKDSDGRETLGKIESDELADGLADKTFNFSQPYASTEWIVIHNFGKFPTAVILNGSDEEMEACIKHISINEFRVYFNNATSGKVVCN